MDCNKEDAIKAMQLAERKMQVNDFTGARKMAQKAQQLFPGLENLSQLLAVCEVHYSAENKLGGCEMDWYGILQVQRFSHEAIIKKQFRKLGLLLHPGTNKFAGAEAAYKLIGEANAVLEDRGRHFRYDMKCRALLRTGKITSAHQSDENLFVLKHCDAAGNAQNIPPSQYASMEEHQKVEADTFKTCCPFCRTECDCAKHSANSLLLCQRCRRLFIASALDIQGMHPETLVKKFSNHAKLPNLISIKVASNCDGAGNPPVKRIQSKNAASNLLSKVGVAADVDKVSNTEKKNSEHEFAARKESVEISMSNSAVLDPGLTSDAIPEHPPDPQAHILDAPSFSTETRDGNIPDPNRNEDTAGESLSADTCISGSSSTSVAITPSAPVTTLLTTTTLPAEQVVLASTALENPQKLQLLLQQEDTSSAPDEKEIPDGTSNVDASGERILAVSLPSQDLHSKEVDAAPSDILPASAQSDVFACIPSLEEDPLMATPEPKRDPPEIEEAWEFMNQLGSLDPTVHDVEAKIHSSIQVLQGQVNTLPQHVQMEVRELLQELPETLNNLRDCLGNLPNQQIKASDSQAAFASAKNKYISIVKAVNTDAQEIARLEMEKAAIDKQIATIKARQSERLLGANQQRFLLTSLKIETEKAQNAEEKLLGLIAYLKTKIRRVGMNVYEFKHLGCETGDSFC